LTNITADSHCRNKIDAIKEATSITVPCMDFVIKVHHH
jgi:hypothetical protein